LERARDAALASEQVRWHLLKKRHAVVSVDLIRGPQEEKITSNLARVVVYSYTDDLVLNVQVDLHDFQVISVSESHDQPPLSPEELDHAIQLATADSRIAGWCTAELSATGILVTQRRGDDGQRDRPERQHREVLVLFGFPNERSPDYSCLVDLSNDTILEVEHLAGTPRGSAI
jgi:hypothetical protein